MKYWYQFWRWWFRNDRWAIFAWDLYECIGTPNTPPPSFKRPPRPPKFLVGE